MSDRARRPTARGVGSYDTGPRRAILATPVPGDAIPVAAEGTAPAAPALRSARAGSEAPAAATRSARAGSEASADAARAGEASADAARAGDLATAARAGEAPTNAAPAGEAPAAATTSSASPVDAALLAPAAALSTPAGHGSWEDPTLVSRSLPAGEPAPADAQRGPAGPGQLVRPAPPLRVISMKDGPDRQRRAAPRVPLHVQLRSIAEAAGIQDSQRGLGNLAPPRDPRQARARRMRGNLGWAFVAIVLASGIAFAIWLVAGR